VNPRPVIGVLLALALMGGARSLAQEAAEPSAPRPVPDAQRVPTDVEDAVLFHAVLGTIVRDLQLPVDGVTLESLDGPAFLQAIENTKVRSDPSDLQDATGVALGSRILVRSDRLSEMTIAQRARLYAHELAHVAQVRLAANGEPSVNWIDEGHAEWVAFQVGDRLGHLSYAASRERVRRRVRASSLPRARFPTLSDLETADQWVLATNQLGWAATYGQAFLAVDRLVERHSAERLRELFRRSGESDSRLRSIDARSAFAGLFARRSWNAVFPVDYRDFVAEFQADLRAAR
jgi:Domain of unknown function (DUF4157)